MSASNQCHGTSLFDGSIRIWRRHVVPLRTTLAELHHILQAAMGWTDSHLHEFAIGGLRYGDINLLNAELSEDDALAFDAFEVRLRDFSRAPGTAFTYVYDFGDNWRHTVTLEKLVAVKPAPKTATCIGGERSCPPEDVGGPDGYFEFLRVLCRPNPTRSRSSDTSSAGAAASSIPNASIWPSRTRRCGARCANVDAHRKL